MMERSELDWGQQTTRFAGALTWILPNPSGLNKSFSLELLVSAYTEFQDALANI
jgi:double-stranded uracil-DNA glycosylase